MRTAADGCRRRGCKGMIGNGGGEKKSLGMSELGCADGCGRRGCKEKKPLGMSELGCADGCRRRGASRSPLGMSELGCADGCGRRGCKGVAGNGLGEEVAGDERAWLRGRPRTAADGVGAKE